MVAVTGGIGAGKTRFSRAMAELPGVCVLDADALVHRALATNEEVRRAVRERFGEEAFGADGVIDRGRLAESVFADAARRRALEEILHPVVRSELAREADALRHREGVAIVLVEVPLLAEAGVPPWCDRVVTVEAEASLRLERLRARGIGAEEGRRRMAAQANEAQRRSVADEIVVNEGDVSSLERAARRLYQAWRREWEEGGA